MLGPVIGPMAIVTPFVLLFSVIVVVMGTSGLVPSATVLVWGMTYGGMAALPSLFVVLRLGYGGLGRSLTLRRGWLEHHRVRAPFSKGSGLAPTLSGRSGAIGSPYVVTWRGWLAHGAILILLMGECAIMPWAPTTVNAQDMGQIRPFPLSGSG